MSMIDMTRRGLRAITRIRTLLASCEANFDEASTRLGAMAKTYLPDEAPPPDYAGILTTHIAILKNVLERIFTAETTFRESIAGKNVLGRAVRGLGKDLEKRMRQFRTSVKQHYGDSVAVTFGLTDVPEGNYLEMLAKARHFLDLTAALDLSQLSPLEEAEALDFAKRIQLVRDLHDATEAKRKEYELAVKDNEIKKAALAEMLAESRNVSVNVAKNQESLYLLAGMDEQARRLRYLVRKPRSGKGKTTEPAGDTEPTGDSAPQAGEPADALTHGID
jgi:hypothetical protein